MPDFWLEVVTTEYIYRNLKFDKACKRAVHPYILPNKGPSYENNSNNYIFERIKAEFIPSNSCVDVFLTYKFHLRGDETTGVKLRYPLGPFFVRSERFYTPRTPPSRQQVTTLPHHHISRIPSIRPTQNPAHYYTSLQQTNVKMAPPSPLAIATSSLQRLVKEEASYYKELEKQEARLKKIEASTEEDENREYTLKQEVSLSQLSPPPSPTPLPSPLRFLK